MILLDIIRNIIKIDKILFYIINQKLSNNLFDYILPFLRAPAFWFPLYLFLTLYVFKNNKFKTALIWFLFFLLIVSFCDIISSHIIKRNIYRMRPCFDPFWKNNIRHLTTYCSSSSSFTSSHACNHFGMAIFFYLTLKEHFKKFSILFFIWAFLICYSQIYVGVHYPLDVLCGGILGLLIGYIGYRNYINIITNKNTI